MNELKKLVINGQEYTVTDSAAVAYGREQALTEEEKAQARQNIGAVSEGVVGDIALALDSIIAMQNAMLGGDGV